MPSPVYISGLGAALPERVLTNEQLVAGMPWLDVSPEWIAEHTGIRQRHVACPGEQATDLGYAAARMALERARRVPEEIDLVMLATNSAQFVYPAGAALIQGRLAERSSGRPGAVRAAALDLQQGCASFVAGLILAAGMLQSGTCHRALVIGADVATRMVDWTDKNAILLGDGAAACVLECELPTASAWPALQILASFMRTIPDSDSIFQLGGLDERNDPFQHIERARDLAGRVTKQDLYSRMQAAAPEYSGMRHFQMAGRQVYRFVRRTVAASGYLEVLCRSGLVGADEQRRIDAHLSSGSPDLDALGEDLLTKLGSRIDRFVAHGANMVLDQELADQMRIPYERMALALQDTGNTSAASVGIALTRLMEGGVSYATVSKRDATGAIVKPQREVVVGPLTAGQTALLLSFGAGTSWNYVAARAV